MCPVWKPRVMQGLLCSQAASGSCMVPVHTMVRYNAVVEITLSLSGESDRLFETTYDAATRMDGWLQLSVLVV